MEKVCSTPCGLPVHDPELKREPAPDSYVVHDKLTKSYIPQKADTLSSDPVGSMSFNVGLHGDKVSAKEGQSSQGTGTMETKAGASNKKAPNVPQQAEEMLLKKAKEFLSKVDNSVQGVSSAKSVPLELALAAEALLIKESKNSDTKRQSKGDTTACDICGKKFAWSKYLKTHMKIHTGDRPHKCEFCDKDFMEKSSLRKHRRIHTKEKPFKCEVCEKYFNTQQYLRLHTRIHSGERPYGCVYCGKTFTNQSSRKRHIRTHTNIKPYKCPQCDHRFSFVNNIKRHIASVHAKSKPYKCGVCNKNFARAENVQKHMKLHTSNDPDTGAKMSSKSLAGASTDVLVRDKVMKTNIEGHGCPYCNEYFKNKHQWEEHFDKDHLQRLQVADNVFSCDICGQKFEGAEKIKEHSQVHIAELKEESDDNSDEEEDLDAA